MSNKGDEQNVRGRLPKKFVDLGFKHICLTHRDIRAKEAIHTSVGTQHHNQGISLHPLPRSPKLYPFHHRAIKMTHFKEVLHAQRFLVCPILWRYTLFGMQRLSYVKSLDKPASGGIGTAGI